MDLYEFRKHGVILIHIKIVIRSAGLVLGTKILGCQHGCYRAAQLNPEFGSEEMGNYGTIQHYIGTAQN